MSDKGLRRLGRADLIEIIYELQRDQQALEQENEELKRKLEQRRVAIASSGTLAEALAKIDGLFDAAQATANDYVKAAQRDREEAQNLLEETKLLCNQAAPNDAGVKGARHQAVAGLDQSQRAAQQRQQSTRDSEQQRQQSPRRVNQQLAAGSAQRDVQGANQQAVAGAAQQSSQSTQSFAGAARQYRQDGVRGKHASHAEGRQ